MPRISKEKRDKISEQALFHLFSIFPKQIFTVDVAKELARDEEFTKILLQDLEKQNLVVKIDKNHDGIKYSRRLRWRISNKAYDAYKGFNTPKQKNQQFLPPTPEILTSPEQDLPNTNK